MLNSFIKICILFKKILIGKVVIKFGTPKDVQIIVYNSDSISILRNILEKKKFIILDFNLEQIKEIYLSFKICLLMISKIFKFRLAENYFFSVIKSINPKIFITGTGNHLIFYKLAKLLDKKTEFIVIQNARRSDFERNDYDFKNHITQKNLNIETYIPHLFCFGQYEIESAKLFNINIKNFYKVGSINTSNFYRYLADNNKTIEKNKFDICLISEPTPAENKRYASSGVEEGYALMAEFTTKFAKKFKLKFVFASKRYKYSKLYPADLFKQEIDFFKRYMNKDNFEYLLNNINLKENFFSSYLAMFQSKVAVGTQSTLLRDKIGVGEKILSCNLTGLKIQDFPLSGICTINNCSYEQFEQRLKEILNISSEEYFNRIDQDKKFVMEFHSEFGAIDKTREGIDKILKRL